jgi:hypothetical protein
MAGDLPHLLNELPVWKLKAIANELRIDVSGCRQKKHYVQKITAKNPTDEQIRLALGQLKKAKEAEQLEREIQAIADKPAAAMEVPEDEVKEIGHQLEHALTNRPAFFPVDSLIEAAHNRMIVGDFLEALRLNREARINCFESFSSFQVYSTALSIKAAEELLSKLSQEGGDSSPRIRTALAEAKKAFIDGPPKRREEALENLEALATKSYSAFLKNSEKEYAELMGLLADYESFGTQTDEARRYLEIAGQAKQSRNLAELERLLKNARASADRAKAVRAAEIDSSYHIVGSAIAEAKEVGVDTASAEKDLERARRALDEGKFRDAVQLLIETERTVDSAHLQQLKSRRDLEARQHDRVIATIASHEPTLMEAAAYGMNVGDGIRSMDSAKRALNSRDLVNAAKHARRAERVASSVSRLLDDKRIELGVMKPLDGVKCGKCGRESIYALPKDARKCVECGHTFFLSVSAAAPEPSATPTIPSAQVSGSTAVSAGESQQKPKKKGFFRW